MAFITDRASTQLPKFPITRTTTMETVTSQTSHSSSGTKGYYRGSRRRDHLMKLIHANEEDHVKKFIHRVRLSNSFAREHHQQQHADHDEENPSNRSNQTTVNRQDVPATIRRYNSITCLPATEKRKLIHRYSSFTSEKSVVLPWRRASGYIAHLSKRIGFSPKNSRQLLSVIPAKSELLEKFRHAVRIMQILIRAVTRAKDSASISSVENIVATTGTTSSFQTAVLLAKSFNDSELIFDPEHFKVNKDQQISNDVKRILRLPCDQRSDSCLHKALLNLRNALDAFSEFPITMQQSLVKVGWYECFEAKRVLIRQGYLAERYYLILNGSAMEDALMNNGRRDSTVTVEQTVEVIMIEKDDFVKIFLQKDEGKEPELLLFLRSVDCFSQWPVKLLRYEDPKQCLQVYFRRGTVVSKGVTSSEWIYVIKSGSCRVVRRLSVPANIARGLNKVCQYGSTNDSKKELTETVPNMTSSSTSFRKVRRRDWWNDPSMLSMKPKLVHRQSSTVHEELGSKTDVFVHIQELKTRDTFGLLPIVFPHAKDDMRDVTLISDGAECVMISSRVFTHRMTEDHRHYLQQNLTPWPSEETLQESLKERIQWQEYKRAAMYDAIGTCSKLPATSP